MLTPSICKPSPRAVTDMNQEIWKRDEMNGERNESLAYHAKQLKIPYFCGGFDQETLPSTPQQTECGIVNLNRSVSNRWVGYWKNGDVGVFLGPLAQVTPSKNAKLFKNQG